MISDIKVNGKTIKNIKHQTYNIFKQNDFDNNVKDLQVVAIRHKYFLDGHELYNELPPIVKVNGKRCYKSPIDDYGNFTLIEF